MSNPLVTPLLHLDGSQAYEWRMAELLREHDAAKDVDAKLRINSVLEQVRDNYRRAFPGRTPYPHREIPLV